MRLIVAEKKNMAEDIARALSKSVAQRAGHFDCGGFCVTWCSGHLLQQCEPEDYDPALKSWSVHSLPIIPNPFKLRPNPGSGPYAGQAARQIEVIRGLAAKASEVIHAGDPDREGQLIVDEVLEWVRCRAPVQRLWLHAQTDEGIREAFARLKPNRQYENLFHAARCRAEADWIVGMNCTRGWTVLWRQRGHQGVANVGRVKTPTLGLVYDRDEAIRSFVPRDFFTVGAEVKHANGLFKATWQPPSDAGSPAFDEAGRLVDQQYARAVVKATNGAAGRITRADKTRKKEPPPLLLSLADAQRAASKMGYSPDEALAALQALYDTHKLTTYPRTDCRYAPQSEWARAPAIMATLSKALPDALPWALAEPGMKSSAWDDAKLGAHFALLPTGKQPDLQALQKRERDIFLLVVRQYAAQFFPAYEYDSTVVEVDVCGHAFKANGQTPVVQGWRAVFAAAGEDAASGRKKKGGAEENQKLPACASGDEALCVRSSVEAKKTEPPPHFTAETLLDAMENVHRYVKDEAVKKLLKQVEGIGTPATRASIIKSLISGNFIEERRVKKAIQYHITERGRALIQSIPNLLRRPDFTALLEGKLEDVASGAMTPDRFRADLRALIERVVQRMKDGSALAEIPPATAPALRSPTKQGTPASVSSSSSRGPARRQGPGRQRSAPTKSTGSAAGQKSAHASLPI